MKKQSPGWDYEEVDVTAFLKDQFPPGAQVDALHETEADSRWRKGIVVKQMEKVTKTESGDESTEFVWQIKSDDDSGDILEPALRQCLADVELRQPTACRLRSGTPALSIGIQIPNVEEFKVKFDKSRLFELYEDSLLGLKEMTEHQKVKLKEMEGLDNVHLSAPAGAGKTFVAVQHVLEHLNTHPSARLLYVAPSESLGLHFIRWLSMRLASRKNHREPELVQSRVIGYSDVRPDPTQKSVTWWSTMKAITSSVFRLKTYPDMARVKLSEVVRSTKRIVAGAATFQLNTQRDAAASSLGSDGPPLKTFLFDPAA
ncbi:unnamed protein product [Symbiodinium sp. KB8]|nr:unnamed protein product [Symbiodinium sp. KB8]